MKAEEDQELTALASKIARKTSPMHESPSRRFARRFRSNSINWIAVGLLSVLIIVSLFAPWLAPYDPLVQNVSARRLPPLTSGHLLGTDSLGRDTLTRLMFGARVALQSAAASVGIGLLLGVVPALVAGYLGRWWDAVCSRIADTLLSFPPLLFAMAIVGVLGPNLTNAMLAIGVVFSPRFFRVVRSSVIEIRQETYIEASHSIGSSTPYILRHHVFPNALSPLIVQIALACGFSILAESALSYLGLGVVPPEASWGSMLTGGREAWLFTPWPIIFPATAIILTVLAFNLLGDGIRESVGREIRRIA